MSENGNRYAKQVESALAKQQRDAEALKKKTDENVKNALATAKEFDGFLRNAMGKEFEVANEGLAPHGYRISHDFRTHQFQGIEGEPTHVLANYVRFWLEKDGRQVGESYHFGRFGESLFRRDREPGRPTPNVNPFAGGLPGRKRQVPQQPLPPEDLTRLYVKSKGDRITLETVQDFISDAINEVIKERTTLTERLFS